MNNSVRSWKFDALTRDELKGLANTVTLVLPLGSTEQHAHHLPVRVDAAVITHLAEESVAQAALDIPVLLLPTLSFGFAQHHLPFGGTVSLRADTYVCVLTDIAVGLAAQGFRRLVFLNGHGGNESPMRLVVDKIASQEKLDLHIAATSYWNVAQDSITNLGFPSTTVPGHAGHFETSLMLSIAPELVHLELRPEDDQDVMPLAEKEIPKSHIRRPKLWELSDGRTDDAQLASAEKGAKALSAISREIADFLVNFHLSSK